MKKERLLTIAVIGLLLLNAGTLLFLVMGNTSKPGENQRPDQYIIERLKLDESQQIEFEKLKHEHRAQVVAIEEQVQQKRKEFFSQLRTATPNQQLADSLALQISALQKEKDMATFIHFSKLRALCTPKQQEVFDTFIDEIRKRLEHHRKPPPR